MLTLHLFDMSDNDGRQAGYHGRIDDEVIWTGVNSFQDVRNELARIGNRGAKIDDLWFHMHGAPGVIGFEYSDPPICAKNVGQLTKVCSVAMATPARVLIAGCNTGEGPQGDAFLRAAGPAMLGLGGGVMLAATSMTFSIPIMGEWLPGWAQVRAAKVSPGGAVVISTTSYVGWSNLQKMVSAIPPLPPMPMLLRMR
jgi:hypothetical protein